MTLLEQMKADAETCNVRMKQHQYCDLRVTPPHIVERREKVKALADLGMSQRALAARLGVSRPTVVKDLKAIGGHYG